MQIILTIVLALLSFSAFAADRTLNAKITHLEELERKVVDTCLRSDDASEVRVTVQGATYTCPQLVVLTNRLHDQINREVTELEACEQSSVTPQGNALATAAVTAAQRAGSCPTRSTDSQCLGEFGCTVMVASNPLGALIGGMSKLAGDKNSCLARGMSSAQNCLANVMKGIFDSLWGLLSLIWDVGKAAVRSAGEWLGIVRRHESSSSDKLMAAQQAGPGFIRKFVSNPVQTMKDMAASMYNGIKEAAMSSYGCERWSGAPFVSRCLQPMTNWQCASCQQKMQLMCGVAGFAVGEIGTALLTGGLAAGGKAVALGAAKAVQAGARARRFSNLAVTAVRSIPKGAEGLAAASRATLTLARGTGRVLTTVEKNAVRAWNAVERSPASRALQSAADRVSRSAAGQATRVALKPAGVYLDALDEATALGFRTVDNALATTTTRGVTAVEVAAQADRATEVAHVADVPMPAAAPASVVRDSRITPELERMGALSDTDRVLEAKGLLNRPLTPEQELAIIEAHNIGAGTGRGYFTYHDEEIVRKGLVLKNNGFSADEIRLLMERGVTGSVPTSTLATADRLDAINASNLAKRTVDRMRMTQDPAQVSELMVTYREQNRAAAQGFANEARERLADGDKAYSIVNTGLAIENYVKAGEATSALQMVRSGLEQGMTREGILRDVSRRLAIDPASRSPEIILQRQTWERVRAELAPRPVVTPTPTPAPRTVASAPTPAPAQRPVAPAQAPAPEVAPVSPPVVEAPVVPQPVARARSPREAQDLANDYRLGRNGKKQDATLSSEYYYQAAEENFKKEMSRKKMMNDDSAYLSDRNIREAFDQSLRGDGKVAIRMLDRLITETKGGHGLNEFFSEMHDLGAYRQMTPEGRANMRNMIQYIEQNHKDLLYDPQRSMMRSWRSANDEAGW